MAKIEMDREDLFQEARGLSPCMELFQGKETIIAGKRKYAGWTIYFAPDRVASFTAEGRYRRGYLNGVLLKAMPGGTITALERRRQARAVQLIPLGLSETEQVSLLVQLRTDIDRFLNSISINDVVRYRGDDDLDVAWKELREFLGSTVRTPIEVADGLAS